MSIELAVQIMLAVIAIAFYGGGALLYYLTRKAVAQGKPEKSPHGELPDSFDYRSYKKDRLPE